MGFAEEGRASYGRRANDGSSLNQIAQVTEYRPWWDVVLVRLLKLREVGCPGAQTGDEVVVMGCQCM